MHGELSASQETPISATGAVIADSARPPEYGYDREIHSLVSDGRYPLDAMLSELVFGLRVDEYPLFDRDNSLPSAVNHEGGLPDNGRNASVGISMAF
ncbi:MAG: hypothetical protein MI976_11700 [Pseudomonadales bacterium]|nr:hypothetical protein [Pseudomonadales bacterium]